MEFGVHLPLIAFRTQAVNSDIKLLISLQLLW